MLYTPQRTRRSGDASYCCVQSKFVRNESILKAETFTKSTEYKDEVSVCCVRENNLVLSNNQRFNNYGNAIVCHQPKSRNVSSNTVLFSML